MQLIFTGLQDIHDPWGKIQFGADSLKLVGDVAGLPPMRVHFIEPFEDGSYHVLGIAGLDRHGDRRAPLRIARARTFDGIHFEGAETVLTLEGEGWLGCTGIARSTRTGDYLVLTYRKEEQGFALWPFASPDARTWRPAADRPVYYDHDAFSLFWDERTGRFLAYQATYQKWNKPFRDNAPEGVRRVLHIRSSEDGLHWEPDLHVSSRGGHVPPERLITPDADDPPDLEFYWFSVFPYADRYAGFMLNYAASPPFAHDGFPWQSHGPYLSCEWWISADGLNWRRPWRDVNASGESDAHFIHAPITVAGRHLWVVNSKAYALPQDRLFFVGSLSNSRFSTRAFPMGKAAITVRAASCFHGPGSRGWREQSYIMAELTDESGCVIPGYEKEKCILHDVDSREVKLHWNEKHGKEIDGARVRLRFHMRDARIYCVNLPAGTEPIDEKI